MRRVTVTVDEAVLLRAQRDVRAGRAESVSAWVADAMRRKARALDELMADIDALNRESPPSDQAIATVARSLGRSRSWVVDRLGLRRRRAG
jgi:Arc/MetJ-type ribon-helix-helix transcriptional regulator